MKGGGCMPADLRNIFTEKQIEVYHTFRTSPKLKLLVLTGAVRAGKTFIDNFLFIQSVKYAATIAKAEGEPSVKYILAGTSYKTIKNNVLSELTSTFGLTFTFEQDGSFVMKFRNLPPVRIVLAYTGSIGGVAGIRGMTSYGAYINEASLAKEEVFEEIRDRCSGKGARVICDTNPDVPTHYLKVLIDNAEETHDETIKSIHFTIFDNKENLDPVYLESIVNSKSGVFYERDILGLWSSGDGIVYSDFDIHENEITREEYEHTYSEQVRKHGLTYIAGVDWGYEHKGCIAVLAVDHKDNFTLIEEHTHKHWQGSDWLALANEIKAKYGDIKFYCDSARPEYVGMFRQNGIRAVNAYKRILKGVDTVASLIKQRKFKVVKESINYFEKELFEYVWDEKTGEPLKADGNDDVMDTVRYAIATYMNNRHNNKVNRGINQSAVRKQEVINKFGFI